MKKTTIAIALVIGLTTAVAFSAGDGFAQAAKDDKAATHDMAQMNTPAEDTDKTPMNDHNMSTMPMAGHDMSKMPMNDRMAMMEKRMAMMSEMMNACGSMMKQHGENVKK